MVFENFFSNLSQTEIIFLIIGFLGQGLFASRFIYQWIYSEKKEKCYSYWFLVFEYFWGFRTFNLCNI